MKILIAVPHSQPVVSSDFMDNLLAICSEMRRKGHTFTCRRFKNFPPPQQRNVAVDYAMKVKADHILWLDSDMIHPINVYERLAKWGEPVVQGLYFTKDTPPRIAAFYKQGPLFHNIREYPPDRLMPIDSGGTGVMLTHTEIFLYLDFPYFEYYRTPLTGKALVGEDTYFMDQCLERGIPMFMDTGCKSTGLPKKEHASEEDYFEFLEAQNRYLASRH